MTNLDVEYRLLTRMDEMELVKQLDRKIWGMDPVPEHQTITAIKNGGIMLGAFLQEKLIGFSYSFPGFQDGKVYLCSHMLGIDPAYQSRGIGEAMKWKQREVALEKGFDLIKWTYDPLETKNGKLNLTKLHGVCHTYLENCYGNMTDKLNKGLPSDRFEVHWYIKSPHVEERSPLQLDQASPLNKISWKGQELENQQINKVIERNGLYCVHVPKDFQRMKKDHPSLAYQWRMDSRQMFQSLFEKGYTSLHVEVKEDVSTYFFVEKSKLSIEGAQ